MTPIGARMERPMRVRPSRLATLSTPVMTSTGTSIINPPIVGVPILVWCMVGSSMRICLPMRSRRSRLMSGPPQMTASKNEIVPSVSDCAIRSYRNLKCGHDFLHRH